MKVSWLNFRPVGGLRRIVAMLAIVAWTFGTFICPNASDAIGAAHQWTADEHHNGAVPDGLDVDPSCQVLAHSSASLQPAPAMPAGGEIGVDFSYAIIASGLGPIATIGPPAAIVRFISRPPRSRSTRFATFWSHAPPSTL